MATDKDNGYSIYYGEIYEATSAQKHQSHIDLDSHFNAKSFQATKNKSFTGLCVKTSASMPTLNMGSALTDQCSHVVNEAYQNYEQTGEHEEPVVLGSSYYAVPEGASFYDGGVTGGFTYFYVGESGRYKFSYRGGTDGSDGWICIWVNHSIKVDADADDDGFTTTLSLSAGDLVTMKLTDYKNCKSGENAEFAINATDDDFIIVDGYEKPFCWYCGDVDSSPKKYNYCAETKTVADYDYITRYHDVTYYSSPNYILPSDKLYNYKGESYSGRAVGLYTFTALTSGTLTATSGTSSSYVKIWKNGEKLGTQCNSSGTYSVSYGDVIVMSFTHPDDVSDSGANISHWLGTSGSFSYSFTGSVGCSTVSHTLTWNEYVRMCLWEAGYRCESYSDYAVPLCFYDDGANSDRMKVLFDTLSNMHMLVDLTINSDNTITGSDDAWKSYCKYLNIETLQSLDDYFSGSSIIKEAAIYTTSSATKAFYNSKSLTSLNINYVNDAESIAEQCANLTTATGGTILGCCSRMFYNDYNLTSDPISFSNADAIDFAYYNCYKVPKSNAQLLTSLGTKHAAEWKNKIYRSTYLNCPYNGTILKKYLEYESQKALGFDQAALCYYALKDRLNSLDPGYENINHSDSTWSEYVADYLTYESPHTLVAVSHQLNESSSAAYLQLDGNIIFTYGYRGTCVGVFDCTTNTVKESDWTDTYGYKIKTTPIETVWQEALAVATSTDIIFVLSYDATSRNSASRQHCLDIGGSTGYGTWEAARFAEAQLGKIGLGQDNGYESIQNGTNSATVTCRYTSDGMVCSTWMDASKNYIFKPGEIEMNDHLSAYYALQVPQAQWWRWKYLIKNIASLSDSCGFVGNDEYADLALSVITDGTDAEINPNSDISFENITENLCSTNMRYHLARVENSTDKDISIKGLMQGNTHLHCVDCAFVNIDDISYAFENTSLVSLQADLEGCTKAQYAFANSTALKTANCSSSTLADGQFMFYNDSSLTDFDISNMSALKDATSMFEKCTALNADIFTSNSALPNTIEIAKRMFAGCNISKIEGNWVPPNSASTFQNTDYPKNSTDAVKNFTDEIVKDGWSFPASLTNAHQMFYGNTELTTVSNLRLNKNANNSWLFQDCTALTTFDDSWIDVNTTSNDYYTGIFDRCALSADNINWLPISIDSSFQLEKTGINFSNNKTPTVLMVDDYWCEVDNSGFIEYQHLRRPPYLAVYEKNNTTKFLIKFWSHICLHSASSRGFNELHDTFVHYEGEETHEPTLWIRSTK